MQARVHAEHSAHSSARVGSLLRPRWTPPLALRQIRDVEALLAECQAADWTSVVLAVLAGDAITVDDLRIPGLEPPLGHRALLLTRPRSNTPLWPLDVDRGIRVAVRPIQEVYELRRIGGPPVGALDS